MHFSGEGSGAFTRFSKGSMTQKRLRTTGQGSDPPRVNFYDWLPKLKLKTFTDINKTPRLKSGSGKEIVLRSTCKLFSMMLVMAHTRQLDMQDVLKHPLGPLSWSLATADGTPRKTNKSALAKELRKNISPVEFRQPKSESH